MKQFTAGGGGKIIIFSGSADELVASSLLLKETQGVCVAAFGESREFPAFFCRQSGFQAPYQVQNEEEAAKLIGEFSVEKGPNLDV